jgi:hypothetical protein
MTARRLHWDDMLVNGIPIPDHVHLSDAELYAIIAAVEDWQARRLGASAEQLNKIADWQWMKVMIPLWHWAQAEAAIQRVRQLCQSAIDESYLTDASIARAGLANRILRALDGDA